MSLIGGLTLLALVIIAVIIFDFVYSYIRSTATGVHRWLDAGRGSATMVVAQVGALTGLIIAAGDQVTDWICNILNAPGADDAIKQALQQWVTPTSVGVALALYALVVAVARARTLKRG